MDIIKILNDHKWYDGYTPQEGEKHLSASSFANEPLEIWLDRHNYPENPFKLSDATVGSIVHIGLENIIRKTEEYKNAELLIEHQIIKPFNGWTITGRPDLVNIPKKILYDYKTGKNYSKKMIDKEGKNHRYAIQLAVYNWLLGGGYTPKILWLMKDSQAGEPVIFEQEIEIMDLNEIEVYMKERLDVIDAYGDSMPDKCGDLWPRKIKGAVVNAKCMYYCKYSHSCPKNNPSASTIAKSYDF
jgi:hypothetical protein